MTEQTNAELIAEARDFVQLGSGINIVEADRLIEELSRELEAAEKRADQAEATAEHLHDEDSREIVALTQERDALAAVLEKVRGEGNAWVGDTGGNWEFRWAVQRILATAPADALRELKAETWDEGDAARRMYVENRRAGRNVTMPRNPYREEQDRG